MKKNKTICLEDDVIIKLKENGINSSELINSLLQDYFLMKGRETPQQLIQAIQEISVRTDISQDEKDLLIKPFKEKKLRMDEEIQRKIEETARKTELQILSEKALFEKKENTIKFCWSCEKNFNMNNLKLMWGADVCLQCSAIPAIKQILLKKSEERNEARKNKETEEKLRVS